MFYKMRTTFIKKFVKDVKTAYTNFKLYKGETKNMERRSENSLSYYLDLIAGWLAFVTAILYAVLIFNANFQFMSTGLLNVFRVIMVYLPLILVAIVGLEFSMRRSLTTRVIFLVVLTIIVIFQFFPNTWANFAGIFG